MANEPQYDVKVIIDEEELGMDVISKLSTKKTIYSAEQITGNANAGQVEMIVRRDISNFSKAAPIKIFVRQKQTSQWKQKGEYFINERVINRDTGVCSINGFDALFKANAKYKSSVANVGSGGLWWGNIGAVMSEILEDLDITPSSNLSTLISTWSGTGAQEGKTISLEEDWTYGEALSRIAFYLCGNFTINDDGMLDFITLSLPEFSNLLINENGDYIVFGDTRIRLS